MSKPKAKKVRTTRHVGNDEVLPEYDFTRSRPNKYASRYAKGSLVVTLDPDVAAVFPGLGRRTPPYGLSPESSAATRQDGRRGGAHNSYCRR